MHVTKVELLESELFIFRVMYSYLILHDQMRDWVRPVIYKGCFLRFGSLQYLEIMYSPFSVLEKTAWDIARRIGCLGACNDMEMKIMPVTHLPITKEFDFFICRIFQSIMS